MLFREEPFSGAIEKPEHIPESHGIFRLFCPFIKFKFLTLMFIYELNPVRSSCLTMFVIQTAIEITFAFECGEPAATSICKASSV